MVETEWQIFQWGIKFDPDLFPFYNPWKQQKPWVFNIECKKGEH